MSQIKNFFLLYIFALSFIGISMASFFIVSEKVIANGEEYNKTINFAGRQRMLSQRITLYAQKIILHETNNSFAPSEELKVYNQARKKFERSHQTLLFGDNTDGISEHIGSILEDINFNEPHKLDAKVREFIKLSNIIISNSAIHKKYEALEEMQKMTRYTLLHSLDEAVNTIQKHADKKYQAYHSIQHATFITIIIILVLEAFLIFLPTHRHTLRILSKIKRSKQEANDNKTRLELALKGGDLGTWDWDIPSGHIIFNEIWANMIGYKLEELKPFFKDWANHIHPDEKDAVFKAWIDHAKGKTEIYEIEHRMRTKDGNWIWILDRGLVVKRDEDGRAVRAVGMHLDISSKKETENLMQQLIEARTKDYHMANKRLTAEEKRIKAIMNHVMEGLIVIDNNGIIHNYNTGAEKIFGWAVNDAMGKNIKTIIPHHFQEQYDETKFGHEKEVTGKKKSGVRIPIALNVTPATIEEENYYIVTTRDISEQKKKEQELTKAKERAEKASQAKDDFLANISHELRTPLNSIMGLTKILKDGALEPKQKNALSIIDKASHSLLKMMNDILDLSKIESGSVELEYSQFDLSVFMRNIISQMKPMAAAKNIDFYYSISEILPLKLTGDIFRFERILINLIGNAIKYTEEGYVRIHVDINHHKKNIFNVKCQIEDTGIGIPHNKIDYIFEKFTQSEESIERRYGGTGLGLNITKKLVLLMKGKITVESTENEGSTFTVEIPFSHHKENEIKTIEYRQEKNAVPDNNPRIPINDTHVLVAEDNEFNTAFVIELLDRLQCNKYKIVDNGEDALIEFQKNNYDLILMDCHMPIMNGYKSTQKIREISNNKNIPIIAMTADVMPETKNKCLESGMDDYISKPIDEDYLWDILKKWFILPNKNKQEKQDSDNAPCPINLSVLDQFTRGDQSKLKELIQLFQTKTKDDLKNMENILLDQNNKEWCDIAHKLKGSAGYVGAEKLVILCEKAQNQINIKPFEKQRIFKEIQSMHQEIYDFIQNKKIA